MVIGEKIPVLGLGFHGITQEQAQEQAGIWLGQEGFRLVVTPNPEFILQAQKDPPFSQVLAGADLVLPDGIGVVYAARILGRPLPGRVPGIEFATGLLSQLQERGGRLFLLGAKEGVAETAGERLAADHPGLVICGCHHGYFTQEDHPEVLKKIQEARPDVLFVCLGAPRQELFLAELGPETGAKLGVGLGGALDVFAGKVERAPEAWRACNLEWLYRLVKEPKRAGRMAKLPLVLFQALGQRLGGKG